MIKVKVIKTIQHQCNRRMYEIGEELMVHDINGISSWSDEYMYRYRKKDNVNKVFMDRIPKECVKVTESKEG